jgi:flagellar L-ring protein precursor FlgH
MRETVKQWRKIGTAGLVLTLLAGCISTHTQPDPAYAATRPAAPVPTALNNGAIYQAGFAVSLFEDAKARHVGDILTIVLAESTNASKKASTETKKENAIDLKDPTLLGSAVQYSMPGGTLSRAVPLATMGHNNLQVSANTKQDFTGNGSSSQSNSLTGNITVTVSEVLSNGNLVVHGEKIMALNEGDEFVRITGMIRPQDIRPDNTVLSTSIANAQISYGGNGAVADSSSHGWLSRFFLKVWPF